MAALMADVSLIINGFIIFCVAGFILSVLFELPSAINAIYSDNSEIQDKEES